jgi:hypothetical protein
MGRQRSTFMKLKSLVAQRGELIINWLAVLVLLGVGVVWLPG